MQCEARTLSEPPAQETPQLEVRHICALVEPRRSMPLHGQDLAPVQRHCEASPIISRILVPTDFSTCSAKALKYAVSLAQQFRANLTVLHVIDINSQSAHGHSMPAADMMTQLWQSGFEQMRRVAFELHGHVDAQTAIEEGMPYEQIIERSHQADLVILGKPCHKPGWKLFSKQTAERVIENAACPVIVVQDAA